MGDLIHEEVSAQVIAAAIEVHQRLGPCLLESAYEACLDQDLVARGAAVRRQVELPIMCKGTHVDAGFRIDLLVDDAVIVELKAVESLAAIHEAQLVTYLRLSGRRVGSLLKFNSRRLMEQFRRLVI